MKTILIGLLQALGGWLAVAAAISWFLQWQYGARPVDTIGIAIFGGGFTWVAFGLFISAAGRWREQVQITSGAAAKRPVNGKQVVLAGTLTPTGPILRAPLDGAACVVYDYQIRYEAGTGERRSVGTLFRGTALTPSKIVTPTGAYKLLAVPEIVPDERSGPPQAGIEHFLDYARRTTFKDSKAAANELLEKWADDDGAYRADVAFEPLKEDPDTRFWIPLQRHVAAGERVCVFGLYSETKGGIVPSVATPTRLIRGSAEEVAAKLRKMAVTRAVIGLALAAVPALVYLMNT